MNSLFMKEDCDLLIRNEKIVVTERNSYEEIKNRITQRVQAQFFDWAFTSKDIANIVGINFGQFVGTILTNDLILKMKENIFVSLTDDDLIDARSINIREVAIDRENIMFYVSMLIEDKFDEHQVGLSIYYNTRQNITSSKIDKIKEEAWA